MSKKSLSQIALEADERRPEFEAANREDTVDGLTDEERREVELDAEDDTVIEAGREEVREEDEEFDVEQSEAFAIESLKMYADTLSHQIATKTVSMESIAVIQMGVQQIYASQGVRIRTIAQESNMSPEAYGTIVLEGIIGALGNAMTVQIKRYKDKFTDIFRSTTGMAKKYREKLESAQHELNSKEGKFQGVATISTFELKDFFASANKEWTKNLPMGLQHDTAMSHFVLAEYPAKIIQVIEKFSQLARGVDPKSTESLMKFFQAVEQLPHPADLFDQKYLSNGKKIYFNMTALDKKVGAKRKVLSFNGASFPKLAELASAQKVTESSSLGHQAKSVLKKVPYLGSIPAGASMMFSGEIKLTAQDTQKVIQGGLSYISGVEQYHELEKKFIAAAEASDQTFNVLFEVEDSEASRLVDQVVWYITHLIDAGYMLPRMELYRAIRAARFCGYAARRAIAHRTNKQQKVAGYPVSNEYTADDEGNVFDKNGNKVPQNGTPE